MCPQRERPRVREPDEAAWSGPVLQLPLGLAGIPEALVCPRSQGTGVSVFSPKLGLLPAGYFESWSSLAFCRIWHTSVMG